jgi:hypothetical protein
MHCTISYVELVVIVELAATCRRHVARRDVGSEGPSPTSCNEYRGRMVGLRCVDERAEQVADHDWAYRKRHSPPPIKTT